MEKKILHVLARIHKKSIGKHEVVFLFSGEGKNFKRVADCTPEIQNMAYYCSPDMISRGIKGHFCYFDCNTKETIVAPENLTYEWLENGRMLVLDSLVFDMYDRSNVGLVLFDFVCKIENWAGDHTGCYNDVKLFVKCGRKARVEIKPDSKTENLYQILKNDFAKYVRM